MVLFNLQPLTDDEIKALSFDKLIAFRSKVTQVQWDASITTQVEEGRYSDLIRQAEENRYDKIPRAELDKAHKVRMEAMEVEQIWFEQDQKIHFQLSELNSYCSC